MVALAKIPMRMSVQEFLAWDPGHGHIWQFVNRSTRLRHLPGT